MESSSLRRHRCLPQELGLDFQLSTLNFDPPPPPPPPPYFFQCLYAQYTRECSALISQYKDAESALLADGSITSTV